MTTETPQLTGRQQKALAALLERGTIKDAAEAAHCSYKTLRRWLREPAFLAELRRLRREVLEESVTLLQCLTRSAVVALGKNLNCGRPSSEIQAAALILDHATKAVELFDVIGRLEAIEKVLARRKP
jgi:hypothetical protein